MTGIAQPFNPTPMHDCPGGCAEPVAHHRFACRSCWRRLPVEYREDIQRTYQGDHGDDQTLHYEHAQAMARAMAWYREHPRHTKGNRTV